MLEMPLATVSRYSSARAAYIVALLFITYVLSYMDRLALAVLLPAIKTEFRLTDLQLGLLSGLAFTLSYALFGIPLARMADNGSRRWVLSVSVLLWSAMTAFTGEALGFTQLVIARIGVGVGEAGCVPPAHSIIADVVSPSKRGLALACYTAGLPIGSLSGLAIGGWLGVSVGWRSTFLIFGAAGIVVAMAVILTLPEPPRLANSSRELSKLGFLPTLKVLGRQRAYVLTLVGLAFAGFAFSGLLQWLPSYFARSFNLSAKVIGLHFGLAYGLGSMLGILAGGAVGDRLVARDRRWPLWMAACAYAAALPLLLGAVYSNDLMMAMTFSFLGFGVLCMPFGPVYAMVQSLVPPRLRALAVSLTLFASSLVGAGFGPLLIGFVSDSARAAGYANPLRIGVLSGMGFFPLPALFYIMASRSIAKRHSLETLTSA
jgi:predicted MFS family arabinose efflux permease